MRRAHGVSRSARSWWHHRGDLATAPVSDAERLASCRLTTVARPCLRRVRQTVCLRRDGVASCCIIEPFVVGLDVFPWSVGTGLYRRRRTRSMSVPQLFAVVRGRGVAIARPWWPCDPARILPDPIAEIAATSVHFVPSMLSFVDGGSGSFGVQRFSERGVLPPVRRCLPLSSPRCMPRWPVWCSNLFGPTEAAVRGAG